MSNQFVGPDSIDYLSGISLDFSALPPEESWQVAPTSARRLETVAGLGIDPRLAKDRDGFGSEPLLAGLAAEAIPFAFQVVGDETGVAFSVGTWAQQDADRVYLGEQQAVVTSLLDGLYPIVERHPAAVDHFDALSLAGMAHGVPAASPDGDAGVPWDWLLRGLHGLRFAVLVLAEPVDPSTLRHLRDVGLEDVRTALAAENTTRGPGPLAQMYDDRMRSMLSSLDLATAVGGWRVGVYLLGDTASYWRLTAGWSAHFAHNHGRTHVPLRVASSVYAKQLALNWALPYRPAPPGPRAWRHPFLNQTLLNSQQLAAYAHLPRRDTLGLAIRPEPTFGVSRATPKGGTRSVEVGEVLARRRPTKTQYRSELDQLTRHTFITGLTGSGKTNTIMHLLTQVMDAGSPFLVIEPAKTEYRELLGRPGLADKLKVFTLGRETISPLRINPFEVPNGIDVSTHVDLLKATFMASFAMWVPLPQVLEQCLVQLYTARGWDFGTGAHHGEAWGKVPRLRDLVTEVERTVPQLGYKAETTQEITAALTTRLNGLRRGARGRMLDVEHSIPIVELLDGPTIIELEALGDDADKAFVMGLLLTRIYEHRRTRHATTMAKHARDAVSAPPTGRLTHVIVIEEAHRLLSSKPRTVSPWHADAEGAFVDTFSHILSEIRAYGQGVVVADQVPVRLAPDVVKNTNLKIVHRLVAGDDREVMAQSMAMDDEQSDHLATLPPGRAAVFSEGDHMPLLVQVPLAKDTQTDAIVDDTAVTRAMQTWRDRIDIKPFFLPTDACVEACLDDKTCRSAQAMSENPNGRLIATRAFHTAVEHEDGIDVVWPDLKAFVAARASNAVDVDSLLHAFTAHGVTAVLLDRAKESGWSLATYQTTKKLLRAVINERAATSQQWQGTTEARTALIAFVQPLQRRTHDPFPLCSSVCNDGRCPFRYAVRDVQLGYPGHAAYAPGASDEENKSRLVQLAAADAESVIGISDMAPTGKKTLNDARWRTVACAALSSFSQSDQPRRDAQYVAAALTAAGWPIGLDREPGDPQ